MGKKYHYEKIAVTMSKELKDKFNEYCKKRYLSMTSMLRLMIREKLEAETSNPVRLRLKNGVATNRESDRHGS